MKRLLSTLFIFFFFLLSLSAQSLSDLENQKQKTQKELAYANDLLDKTQKNRINSVNQLNILKKQLLLQNQLVSQTQTQIELLEQEISEKQLLISDLNTDLENLKTEYAKLIVYAKRNSSQLDLLVFIFSAQDFNQAYLRIRFYKQFMKFRAGQAKQIEEVQNSIIKELASIEHAANLLKETKQEKTRELNSLHSNERSYQTNINKLRQQENQLRKDIEKRKASMAALDKAIADLIAEEARKAATTIRDARYLNLSAGFQGNKGRLPWPTAKGVITGLFGEHNHPVLKGVKIKNNGVDITTDKDSYVRAIFEGEVKKIVSIPGSNMAVLVRHGDFLTVYSNITKISVKVGDTVKALQSLGQVFTDPTTQKGIYNLQIWQENTIQNPTNWILP